MYKRGRGDQHFRLTWCSRSPVSMNSNRLSQGYVKATKGYVIYSPRAQPEVNKSHIHEVPWNNGFLFHKGEVSEWWRKTMVDMFFFVVLKSRPIAASRQIVLSIYRHRWRILLLLMPTRTSLAGQTRGCFVQCLANLNIKRNLTTKFGNKYLPYGFGKINTSLFSAVSPRTYKRRCEGMNSAILSI